MQTPVSMPWFRTRPRALHTFAPVFPPFHPLPRWEAQTKPLSKQLRSLHKAEVAPRPVSSLTQHASAVSHLNLTFQTSVSYPKRRQNAFGVAVKEKIEALKWGKTDGRSWSMRSGKTGNLVSEPILPPRATPLPVSAASPTKKPPNPPTNDGTSVERFATCRTAPEAPPTTLQHGSCCLVDEGDSLFLENTDAS